MGQIKDAIEINKNKEGYSLKNLIDANKHINDKLESLAKEIYERTGVNLTSSFLTEEQKLRLEGNEELVEEYRTLFNKANLARTYAIDGTDLRVNLSGVQTLLYKEIAIGHSDSYFEENPYNSDFYLDAFNKNQIKINCQDENGDFNEIKLMDINTVLNGIKVQGNIPDIIKCNM